VPVTRGDQAKTPLKNIAMTNYIKQIWYELRHQPMVTVTSILGTAFAIFLVMAVFMTSSIDTVEVSPESNRSRILTGKNIDLEYPQGSSSGSMSNSSAKKLYSDLKGIEKIAFSSGWDENEDVSVKDGDCISLLVKNVDNVYWDIFDYKFLSGKPFDKATSDAGLKKAIITKSVSKRFFGDADATGQEIKISHVPYIVQGVVEDTSPLMPETFAKVFTPYQPEAEGDLWMNGYGGDTKVYLLMKEGTEYEDIRSQVINRYNTLNASLAKEDSKLIYHQAPYTAEAVNLDFGSNTDPDVETPRNIRYAVYFILLLLPAINLSSMTRSRLRRRVSEIGVRRAFGATKSGIMGRFLGENLVLTLAGGIIGLILCVIFLALFSNLFISYGGQWGSADSHGSTPTFSMLLNFKTFGIALVFCLILNLLSTGLPAWRASRVNPAEAISGKND